VMATAASAAIRIAPLYGGELGAGIGPLESAPFFFELYFTKQRRGW
jgi:hypothetical protein